MTTLWTEQRLQEVEARLKAATPGPWESRPGMPGMGGFDVLGPTGRTPLEQIVLCTRGPFPDRETEMLANMDLIAHACTDLADAVAEIRTLQAVLVRVAERHRHDDNGFCDWCGNLWPCADHETVTALSLPATDSPGTG